MYPWIHKTTFGTGSGDRSRESGIKHAHRDHQVADTGRTFERQGQGASSSSSGPAPMVQLGKPFSSSGPAPMLQAGRAPGGPPTIHDVGGKTMEEQLQMIGDYLYSQIRREQPRATKLVGMLLHGNDRNALLDLCV